MQEDLIKQFSDELKNTRESKEITLEHISGKTRIDIKFLEAIEEGNFKIIDEIYLRAFIREYASSIGLDGMEILKKYDQVKSGKIEDEKLIDAERDKVEEKEMNQQFDSNSAPAYTKSYTKHEEKDFNISDANKKKIIFIGGGALIVLILVFIGYKILATSEEDIITETSYEEVIEDQSQRYEEKEIKKNELVPVSDSLILKFVASDTVWVMVEKDDVFTQDFTMVPGVTKEVKAAKKFNLTIGNSGGVALYLNDELLNFTGKKGRVRYMVVDETGLRVITNPSAGDQ